jgi:hypothetical protein
MGLVDLRVILHLGYPKTASSSLQFGPFKDLETAGKVSLKTWRKYSDFEHLDTRPSSALFNRKQIEKSYLDFSKKNLNILSDESFTAPLKLRHLNYGDALVNPHLFPKMLKDEITQLYGQSIQLDCLVTIRNQASLISSQYVEEYNWKRYRNRDLLFDENGALSLQGFEIYFFHKYLSNLIKLFGKESCCFLLYEDMLGDKDFFHSKLDNFLDVDPGYFERALTVSRVNTKVKSKYGTFTKDGKYFVPKFREEVLEAITQHFGEDNSRLDEFFPASKLRWYGYI